MGETSRLVYLDHSTIITLERAFKRDRTRFEKFVQRWHVGGCTLALSFVHAMEVCGSAHRDSRDIRMRVLDALGPARTDLIPNASVPSTLQQLTGREVFARVGHAAGRAELLDSVDRYWIAFPTTLPKSEVGRVLRHLTSSKMRGIYRDFHAAFKLEAKALTRSPGTKLLKTRLRDLPSGPLASDQANAVQASVRAVLDSAEFTNDLIASFPQQLRARAASEISARMLDTVDRMISVGPREVFAESVGAGVESELKRFTHELASESVFKDVVDQTIGALLKKPETAIPPEIARSIRLQDCPGTWLRFAVERELQNSKATWEPGAAYDLLHLAHLPYVDLMFTDAEIADNTAKVLNRAGVPESLLGTRRPIAIAGSVEAIEQALDV